MLFRSPYLQTRSYVNPNIDADTGRYRDASNLIKDNRQEIIDYAFNQMQTAFPTFTVPGGNNAKCKRDIGYIVDALAADLYNGGNESMINATKSYFGAYAPVVSVSRTNNVATVTTSVAHNLAVGAVVSIDVSINSFDDPSATVISVPSTTTFTYSNTGVNVSNTATGTVSTASGSPIANGLVGEETQSIFAFNRARDWSKKAISNLLGYKSLLKVTTITATGTTVTVTVDPSAPHGLKAGDKVTIGGATQAGYNGKWTVLSTGLTTTQFKVTVTTTPAASPATGAFYASTITIDPKNSLGEAGRYKDASNLVTSNRQEIIDRAFAAVSLNYDESVWGTNWVTPGDNVNASVNRYRDAYRLIQKNRDEIIDRASAEIGVQYPDFYYPGDAQTNPTSRYKDAYRLIQQNKEEIRDRSLVAIATAYDETAWGNNWTFPGDPVTTSYSRYWDAIRLIQKNRNIIIETAYATVVANPPSPAPSNMLSECKRDIGHFIDAVCMDIAAVNANRYTLRFVQQYFSGNTTLLSNGLLGEVTQSITAFNKARDAMKAAITNTLLTFTGVVTSSPAGGSWADGTTGSLSVYTDLTITSGPSTYGGGGGNIANNNSSACADVRSAVDTLAAIVSTTLTAVNLGTLPAVNNGTLWQSGVNKCFREDRKSTRLNSSHSSVSRMPSSA